MRNIRIAGIAKHLPEHVVTSEEIDDMLGLKRGWTEKKSGVKTRRYAKGESSSSMGAKAAKLALLHANLTLDDIDCIVSTSGSMQQPIPCTASLIHEHLKPNKPIPAFDVNSTCLSFVTGLDIMSHVVHAGGYKRVLLVSTEVASAAINPQQKESYVLFGDAAVACVIEASSPKESSCLLGSKMNTYSEGAHLTEVRGGGTHLHPNRHKVEEDYLFDMDGKEVFRMSSKVINQFVDDLLKESGVSMEDIELVIPHQASGMALRIMESKLHLPPGKFVNVIEHYGNTIASSIPLALHDMIHDRRLQRGQKAMLIGTSAGLSVGGLIFEF